LNVFIDTIVHNVCLFEIQLSFSFDGSMTFVKAQIKQIKVLGLLRKIKIPLLKFSLLIKFSFLQICVLLDTPRLFTKLTLSNLIIKPHTIFNQWFNFQKIKPL